MAVNKYVLTATVKLAPGTLDTPGQYGTEDTTAGYGVLGQTITKGTAILLDPAGPEYAAIGAGNLRAWVPGQDDVGHGALSN